jgi:uncharacterized SAM-binding protein YcdF (DUF218 family)
MAHFDRLRNWILPSLLLGPISGAFFTYFSAGEIYNTQDTITEHALENTDLIVCLAGGRGRITAAFELWHRYWERNQATPSPIPMLYFAGMGKKISWNLLVKPIRKEILSHITPSSLFIERESFNTKTNALYLVDELKKHSWHKIILITSSYHMRRARIIFEETFRTQGYFVEMSTYSITQEPFTRSHWKKSFLGIQVTFSEYLKWLYYKNFSRTQNTQENDHSALP